MEWYIKKNATLPVLKIQVVNDGRSDYNDFMDMIEESTIFFSMVNVETGIPKITTNPAGFVEKVLIDPNFIELIIFFFTLMGSVNYKPHIFTQELKDTFPYEDSLICLSNSSADDLKQAYVHMFVITYLYFFHVKKDFTKIKTLTFSDFKTNSIMERLNYRKFILSKNIALVTLVSIFFPTISSVAKLSG